MEEVERKVKQGTIKKLTVAAHLVHVGRVIKWVVMQKLLSFEGVGRFYRR
jgi:hypothetical protein